MIRLSAHRGNAYHAPGNSAFALVSAYTAGADVLEIDVQLTKDGELVAVANVPLEELTDTAGSVADLTNAELHQLDLGAKFKVRGPGALTWKRDPPHVRSETLGAVLDLLPPAAILVIEAHLTGTAKADQLVKKIVATLERRGKLARAKLASAHTEVLAVARQHAPQLKQFRVSAGDGDLDLSALIAGSPDGLIVPLGTVLGEDSKLTALGNSLKQIHEQGKLPLGVILRSTPNTEVFTETQFKALDGNPFVYALSTASVIDVVGFVRSQRTLEEMSFAGKEERVSRIRFGYAKANRYAHVFQDDGVHIKIAPYQEPPAISAPATSDPVQNQLNDLQEAMWAAQMDWPFYSGGGFGTNFGIDGDFAAEVNYSSVVTSQATMLEMACVNVDPSKHMPGFREENGKQVPNKPQSFRDKSAFFNPHGAPPFVGVEHDEDDGYRINWNLGSEYDGNQYGRPHGDGNTKTGRFRLERRGSYFAAYYKDEQNQDWVCVGTCRNDSMNERVFIRCAGKRWRQEDITPGAAQPYFPIVENHFIFKNFIVVTPIEE